MEIGKKLKNARIEAGLTQEKAAEKIDVSRQTISNWENEKSYPDIISVIALSDLYSVSLDELLKGDQKMAEHLEESTNVVKSNKKLTGAILLNIILMILLIALNMLLPEGTYYLVIVFCVVIMSSSALLYQIIKRIWEADYYGMESNSSSSKRSNCVGRSNLHRMADLSDDGIRCKSKRLKAPEILGGLGDEWK